MDREGKMKGRKERDGRRGGGRGGKYRRKGIHRKKKRGRFKRGKADKKERGEGGM